jgi:hypothetical protein
MKRILFVLLVPSLALADQDIRAKTATIDCAKDPNVAITAGEGSYTLKGVCDKVSINGGQNTVTIESVKKLGINGSGNKVKVATAEKIAIVGSNNDVEWNKGPAGKKPTIGSVGENNKVTQK